MPGQSNIRKLEQGRAAEAYEFARGGASLDKDRRKEYKSYAKNIPMLIKTNGLGATLAFVKAKAGSKNTSENAYALLYNQINRWLNSEQNQYLFINGKESEDDLVEKIIRLDSPKYRAATREVLALFTWVRRFAEGLIEGEANE